MSGTQAPSIRNGSLDGGSIIISHKEFLGDVISGGINSFNINNYRINPGDENTFPWLSQIAKNFQQYRLRGLCFHFKSMSGDALNSTNTALGQVIMATNYDATQPDPISKNEMENMEFGQSIKPSKSLTHFVECAKSQSPLTELYVNESTNTQQGDQRFYDFGKFHIATNGLQANLVNLGELWVSYEIQLYKPQLWDAMGRDVSFFFWRQREDASNPISSVAPLGNTNWVTAQDDRTNPQFYSGNTLRVTTWAPTAVLFKARSSPGMFIVQWYIRYEAPAEVLVNMEQNVQFLNCLAATSLYTSRTQTASAQNAPQANMPVVLDGETPEGNCTTFFVTWSVKVDGPNIGKDWGFQWTGPAAVLTATILATNIMVTEIPYSERDVR